MRTRLLLPILGIALVESLENGAGGSDGGHMTKGAEEQGRNAVPMIRSKLPPVAVSDGASSSWGSNDCRSVCAEDVLGDDICIATSTNPIPDGDVWMFDRDESRYGCCAFGMGACKVCCPPSEEERRAFEEADIDGMVRALFHEMDVGIDHFDDESNADDPWNFFAGTCLTLSNFTVEVPGVLPIAHAMQGIVWSGMRRNGRTRNGIFFFTDGYHEVSPLAWAGAGSITYRVLGYDDSGEAPGPRRGLKRVVQLPWQLAPHGEAVFAELDAEPKEYGPGDKIAYRLVSPYMGVALVKFTCCTADERAQYEELSEGALGFMTRPDPPVHFTRTAEQCEQMEPAYERVL